MGNAEKTWRWCSRLYPAYVFSAPSSEAHGREESLRAPGRHKQLKVGLASPLGQIAMAKLTVFNSTSAQLTNVVHMVSKLVEAVGYLRKRIKDFKDLLRKEKSTVIQLFQKVGL